MIKQRTLKNTIRATGVGVHRGERVQLSFAAAPINTGIVFRRVDCDPVIEIPALADYVGNIPNCTVLQRNGVQVATVEHLLSALMGMGIDNVYIDLTASELPIMDGSAAPFVFLLKSAGIVEQDAPKSFLRILQSVEVSDGDRFLRIEPFDGFKVDFEIDYQHPAFDAQHQSVSFNISNASYAKDIARARTFGFLADYEYLKKHQLALGASLDNTVVLDDQAVMNDEGLRYPDECVKHKILDVIGDLYLLGYSVLGAVTGYKSGHALNAQLVRKILASPDAWELVNTPIYDGEPIPVVPVTAEAE